MSRDHVIADSLSKFQATVFQCSICERANARSVESPMPLRAFPSFVYYCLNARASACVFKIQTVVSVGRRECLYESGTTGPPARFRQ